MIDLTDPRLAHRLDAFTVPDLPADFAARVAAKVATMPQAAGYEGAPLPRRRGLSPRRWLRTGGLGLGALAAGMISISVAAMGYFGEPIAAAVHRAPLVGKVIERVIPERPRRPKVKAQPAALAPKGSATPSSAVIAPPSSLPVQQVSRFPAQVSSEQRQAWIAAHPKAAERIERRQARIEANPAAAERISERRQRRRALIHERLRESAGDVPRLAPSADRGAPQIEYSPATQRRQRLREWRERRRMQRSVPSSQPEPR
jgi:hypothetical protein